MSVVRLVSELLAADLLPKLLERLPLGWRLFAQGSAADSLGPRRYFAMMVLVALLIVVTLITTALLVYGRAVRRLARHEPPQRQRDPSDWDTRRPAGEDDDGP